MLLIALVMAVVVSTRNDSSHVELAVSGASSGSASHSSISAPIEQLADATPADRFDPTTEGAQCYACEGGVLESGSKKDAYHVARLVGTDNDGTDNLCGRAEVKHGETWGTICYEGWSTADAQVFCKTMGLTGGTARFNDGLKPTWDDTAVTHTAPKQPAADTIWMDEVSCLGTEGNIMDCPFGGKPSRDASAWINYGVASASNCDHSGDVALCCDVSAFCPERSHWRPDQHDNIYQKQMFLGNMKPDQRYPEMLANCKCDAGFYMVASGVYGGRCEECMENACSPVGSISEDQCSCLPGFYKADGACVECPDNSCSPAGSTSVDSCKCFEGYFFNATDPDSPECTTCPPHTTSRRGSSSPEECSYDCGLPPAPVTLGKELEALAKEADAAEAVRQRALRIVEASIRAKDAAVKALNKQIATDKAEIRREQRNAEEAKKKKPFWHSWFNRPPPPPVPASVRADRLARLAKRVSDAEEARAEAETAYLTAGEKKASLLRDLHQTTQARDHESWIQGNEIKECHPMSQRCYSRCRGSEPSNPCEPWPSCYPKPCSPWPACMYGPEGMHPANVPKTDKEWDKYEEGHNFPEACTPKYEGLVDGWSFDCSEKLMKARQAILAEVSKAEQLRAETTEELQVEKSVTGNSGKSVGGK